MRILFIFLDGVGLGSPDIEFNPFASAELPTLHALTHGNRWLNTTSHYETDRTLFIPTDPRMGVAGRPQSGTGQAAIVTGRNIPRLLGQHYGPKPDAQTRTLLEEDNIFKRIVSAGKRASLLEAYPPAWHRSIERGKRLPSSYQYAARAAGLPFFHADDLRAMRALSGDWTGEAWRNHLGYPDMPLLTPYEAGQQLVTISKGYSFSFFPHWMTDITGHRGTLDEAVHQLETIDAVMAGILDAWDDSSGLVIMTSDHGNIEDLSHRKHTENDVPSLIIGNKRQHFRDVHTLADLAPRILSLLLN